MDFAERSGLGLHQQEPQAVSRSGRVRGNTRPGSEPRPVTEGKMTEPCLGARIRSGFSLSLPLIVAGEGKGPQGIRFQRSWLLRGGGEEGRVACRGGFVCAEGWHVSSEGLKEREPHFTPCTSHQLSAPRLPHCTASDSTALGCWGSAPRTTGPCTYTDQASPALCWHD